MCYITEHIRTQKYVPKLLINKNIPEDKIILNLEEPKEGPDIQILH